MDKGNELLVKISDAIGACRLEPTIGHEFTIKMPEKVGGGTFKISVQNANQPNKQPDYGQMQPFPEQEAVSDAFKRPSQNSDISTKP